MDITKFNARGAIGAVTVAAAMLVAGPVQAALQDRDLNADSIVDAFYDTDLDITWLRDANVNGEMTWDTAMAWAAGYSLGGYSGWRLPTSDSSCSGYDCTSSEMGHLWYVELGNPAGGPMSNTGDFLNLAAGAGDIYWSSTLDPRYGAPVVLSTYDGYQTVDDAANPRFSFGVRNGDVAVVPEPETYALMLAGLGALALSRRLQRS